MHAFRSGRTFQQRLRNPTIIWAGYYVNWGITRQFPLKFWRDNMQNHTILRTFENLVYHIAWNSHPLYFRTATMPHKAICMLGVALHSKSAPIGHTAQIDPFMRDMDQSLMSFPLLASKSIYVRRTSKAQLSPHQLCYQSFYGPHSERKSICSPALICTTSLNMGVIQQCSKDHPRTEDGVILKSV